MQSRGYGGVDERRESARELVERRVREDEVGGDVLRGVACVRRGRRAQGADDAVPEEGRAQAAGVLVLSEEKEGLWTCLSKPCAKRSAEGESAAPASRRLAAWSRSHGSRSPAFHDAGGAMPSLFVLSAIVSYLLHCQYHWIEGDKVTHSLSISWAYSASACLRMTVPFPARGRGRSGSVTRIISLNTFANAGASAFASSTVCLSYTCVSCRIVS